MDYISCDRYDAGLTNQKIAFIGLAHRAMRKNGSSCKSRSREGNLLWLEVEIRAYETQIDKN